MIRGSDGYEYEDLTARLVGRQASTAWNRDLRACHAGPCPEDEARAYAETYDNEYRCLAPCHGHTAAHNTALEAARGAARRVRREWRSRVRDDARAGLTEYLHTVRDHAAFAALAGASPTGIIFDELGALDALAVLAFTHAPAAGPAGAGGAHPGQAPTHSVHPAP